MKSIWKSWKSIFSNRFLPSLPLVTETRLNIAKPQGIRLTDRFLQMWKQMATEQLILESGYTKTLCDFYSLSAQKEMKKRISKDCEIDFPSLYNIFTNC